MDKEVEDQEDHRVADLLEAVDQEMEDYLEAVDHQEAQDHRILQVHRCRDM